MLFITRFARALCCAYSFARSLQVSNDKENSLQIEWVAQIPCTALIVPALGATDRRALSLKLM